MTSALKIAALKSLVATTDVQWCIFQDFIKKQRSHLLQEQYSEDFLPMGKCKNTTMKN